MSILTVTVIRKNGNPFDKGGVGGWNWNAIWIKGWKLARSLFWWELFIFDKPCLWYLIIFYDICCCSVAVFRYVVNSVHTALVICSHLMNSPNTHPTFYNKSNTVSELLKEEFHQKKRWTNISSKRFSMWIRMSHKTLNFALFELRFLFQKTVFWIKRFDMAMSEY